MSVPIFETFTHFQEGMGIDQHKADLKLARTLILDELFDLSLYRKLHTISDPELQKVLSELTEVEVKHFAFWQHFSSQ